VRRKGFTLVELLIALLIISILAAMLFPVFARARESARKTTCLSSVAQLGTALQMYAVDWYGALPPKDNDWAPLYDYIRNVDVLHCPTDPEPVRITGDPQAPGGRFAIPYSSYVYRSGLTGDGLAAEVVAFDRQIWHLGGRNVVFLDAHAKWFAAASFWYSASDRLLALDPAFQALSPSQQQAAREGGPLPGSLPWR
jgi:prepilin-type N-terminal cleavage/methylation domain-containing protein/prepilin-type processing-associated H-X9-DG protein